MDAVIGLVDIGTAIDDRVDSYSGGMKRRLDLAMSLIHRPQILFLDEPTTGLDPASRSAVWAEVRRLNGEFGTTIFLTTQYLEEADELADRVGIISNGLIKAEGTPTDLKRSIGTDLIVAEVGGDIAVAAEALRAIDGIDEVEIHNNELALATPNGAGLIAQVAVALNGCGVPVRSLTLRTPTLDDVFLHVTGTHLAGDKPSDDGARDADLEPGGRIMSTTSPDAVAGNSYVPLARRASMWHDFSTIAHRAIRGVFREPEFFIPALITPVFFFVVQVGALQDFAEGSGTVADFKAFQLPVAIIFAVTGVSRASALVTDIQSGYFDRLLLTPIRRPMLLLGLMAADFVSVILLTIPVLLLGLVLGVTFETGVIGMLVFLLYGAMWGLAFAGFPYAIALKTGNPGAVNASFILFFPFAFLTTTFLPKEALTGWLSTVATYNPVTYVLAGLRSVVSEGWKVDLLLQGFAASIVLMVISFGLASLAMRGRIHRG